MQVEVDALSFQQRRVGVAKLKNTSSSHAVFIAAQKQTFKHFETVGHSTHHAKIFSGPFHFQPRQEFRAKKCNFTECYP